MNPRIGALLFVTFAALACVVRVDAAQAQAGCTVEQIGGTSRQMLECDSGLTAIVERGANFFLLDRTRDGKADAIRLDSGGLLLEFPEGQTETPIEVVAPQAIAAVRGTRWVVDVTESQTSVFVIRGSVAVRRPSGAGEVVLAAGDGVDVTADSGPLTVKRWPSARVSALLERFGQ